MKEYIYLDEDMLNSTLAQLDEGLLQSFSEGSEAQSSNTEDSTSSVSKGLDGVLQVGAKYVKDISEKSGHELTRSQSKALDYALNDYAVDVLLRKIENYENFTSDIFNSKEGQIVNFSSTFRLYDFNLIKEITDEETIGFLFEEENNEEIKVAKNKIRTLRSQKNKNAMVKEKIKKIEADIKEIESHDNNKSIDLLHKGSRFADKVLGGSNVLRANSSLSLCKRECFRLNKGQLALINETSRRVQILGIVSAIKEETHPKGDFDALKSNEMNKVTNMMIDIFLSSFNMIFPNDRIITPIAIFFE